MLTMRARLRKGTSFIVEPILVLLYIVLFGIFAITAYMAYAVSSISIADSLYKPFAQVDYTEAYDDVTFFEFLSRRQTLAGLALGGSLGETLAETRYALKQVSNREGVLIGNKIRIRSPFVNYNLDMRYLQLREAFNGKD